MKTILSITLLLIYSIVLQSCNEEVTATTPTSSVKDKLIQKTSIMSLGKVISVDATGNDKIKDHWEVKVDMPGEGGMVKFKYTLDTQALRQLKGLTPSFEYEINPGIGVITYSAARLFSLEAVNGEITEWKLEKDVSDNQWQYRFEIISSGKDYEVRINASDGTIIRIKN